jgi:hypothetical protein
MTDETIQSQRAHQHNLGVIMDMASNAQINGYSMSDSGILDLSDHIKRYMEQYGTSADAAYCNEAALSEQLKNQDKDALLPLYSRILSDMDELNASDNVAFKLKEAFETLKSYDADVDARITQYDAAKWIAEDMASAVPSVAFLNQRNEQMKSLTNDLDVSDDTNELGLDV